MLVDYSGLVVRDRPPAEKLPPGARTVLRLVLSLFEEKLRRRQRLAPVVVHQQTLTTEARSVRYCVLCDRRSNARSFVVPFAQPVSKLLWSLAP
jgi:hypothetical protein